MDPTLLTTPAQAPGSAAHLAAAAAAGRLNALPQHPMSHLRVIFLAVLVAFFCTLFIASYVWMRRPNFGQLEGGRGKAEVKHPNQRERGAGVPGPASGATDQNGPVRSPSAPVRRRFSA